MLTIKQILFPTDFSKRSEGAVPFVKEIAKQYGAEVTLISVLAPFWQVAVSDPGGTVSIDMEQLKRDLDVRLEGTYVSALSGMRVKRVTRTGEPAEEIVEFAESEGMDLIMMPTHGYGPFRSLLLGSVTAKVLHDAQCPVWTAAHVEEAEAHTHLPVKRVLCAIDGTPKSVPVMEWAAEYAKMSGSELRIVHAVAGVEAWPERALNRDHEEQLASGARTEISKMLTSAHLDVPLCVEVGEPAQVVRQEAQRHNSDVVVIGRGILHERLGRLRTQAYGIIRNAPCPVMSI